MKFRIPIRILILSFLLVSVPVIKYSIVNFGSTGFRFDQLLFLLLALAVFSFYPLSLFRVPFSPLHAVIYFLPLIALFSISFLWLAPNNLSFVNVKNEITSIQYTKYNITQFIQLTSAIAFVFLTTRIVYNADSTINRIKLLLPYIALGCFILCIYGLIELIFLNFGVQIKLPLPLNASFLVRNLELEYNTARMNSFLPEASVMALFSAVYFYLLLLGFYLSKKRNTKIIYILLIVFDLLCLLLTYSSTSILALLFIGMFFLKTFFSKLTFNRLALFTVLISLVALFIYFTGAISYGINRISQMVNLSHPSGIGRFTQFLDGINLMIASPIVGAGYGNFHSADLLSHITGNLGAFGLIWIITYIFVLWKTHSKNKFYLKKINDNSLDKINKTLYWCCLQSIVIQLFSVSETFFFFIWIAPVFFGSLNLYLRYRYLSIQNLSEMKYNPY